MIRYIELPRIVVIGGGPAGLMAAGRAAEVGGSVTLIEKMSSTARKLRITGGGRCNVTNTAELGDFILHFGRSGKFIRHALARFSAQDLISFFVNLGVKIQVEADGRAYPTRGGAEAAARSLERWVESRGVSVVTGLAVRRLIAQGGRITGVETERNMARDAAGRRSISSRKKIMGADAIVLSVGGASYPATGSSGDGSALAAGVGHTIVPLRPALVPLLVKSELLPQLQGLSLDDVEIKLTVNGRLIARERGEMIFTHFGISGPAVLNLSSHAVSAVERKSAVNVGIDFFPGQSDDEIDSMLLEQFDVHGKQMVRSALSLLMPARLAAALTSSAGVDPDKRACQVSSRERHSILGKCRRFDLEITGHRSFREAMVTAGGVSLDEVNPRTMESRLVRGLYFAGEVLDIDADTGGFNLQAAFSTGWLAGTCAKIGLT